jgi:hypothetical protein
VIHFLQFESKETGEIYLRMTVQHGSNSISYGEIGEQILKKVEEYEKFLF